MSEAEAPVGPDTPTHAEWWNGAKADAESVAVTAESTPFNDAQAAASLRRAGLLVIVITVCALPVAWVATGWRGAASLAVGALISGSGLWEWRRLMAALTANMDAQEAVHLQSGTGDRKPPAIGFAIAGFIVRLLVVAVVLYASLKYLHGSVPALAAGLAMGVVALTVEAVRLLRSGTI